MVGILRSLNTLSAAIFSSLAFLHPYGGITLYSVAILPQKLRSQNRGSCCMVKDSYPTHCLECIPASSKTDCTATHNRMSN